MNRRDSESELLALKLIAGKRPLVIGHRGYCQLAPENTIPSFQLAMAAGADLVELDYQHSEDGQLVVIHDATLDRTTDAVRRWRKRRIKVETKTAVEIQTLDAGSWFGPRFAGMKIPFLGEALDTIQQSSVPLIERKAGAPAECIKLLRNGSLINKVVVQAFDWEYLREFHEQEPTQVMGALGPPTSLPGGKTPPRKSKMLDAGWLDWLHETGARIAVWNQKVSKESVKLAHERGFKVWIYTINNPRPANRLLDMGVDGIITNKISVIQRVIELRGNPIRTSE